MNFSYIKSQGHLLEIPILYQMVTMYEEYQSAYQENSDSSFQSYYSSLDIDPVRDFIETVIGSSLSDTEADHDNVLNYLTRLFYSVKGTVKVFDYMDRYLPGLHRSGDVIYDGETLSLALILSSAIDNTVEFRKSFSEFLQNLLYLGEGENIVVVIPGEEDPEVTEDPKPYRFQEYPQVLKMNDLIGLYGSGKIKTYKLTIVKRDESNTE